MSLGMQPCLCFLMGCSLSNNLGPQIWNFFTSPSNSSSVSKSTTTGGSLLKSEAWPEGVCNAGPLMDHLLQKTAHNIRTSACPCDKTDKRVLDPGDPPQIGDMVSVCARLVTVDQQSDLIRLVHYTTQQYFDANRTLFSNAEANITTTCVIYLSFYVYESGFCPTDEELAERIRLKSFYDYSAQHWAEHARKGSTLCQEVIDFLESDTKVQLLSQPPMQEIHPRRSNVYDWTALRSILRDQGWRTSTDQ